MTTHGETNTSLYKRWCKMKSRCTNPNDWQWKDYGGRGITLCQEWFVYEMFAEWAKNSGYKPHLTLDRKDNNKGYSPENCRWVSQRVQHQNKRSTVHATAFGETKPLIEWARDKRFTIKYVTLLKRLRSGLSLEVALLKPHRSKNGYLRITIE